MVKFQERENTQPQEKVTKKKSRQSSRKSSPKQRSSSKKKKSPSSSVQKRRPTLEQLLDKLPQFNGPILLASTAQLPDYKEHLKQVVSANVSLFDSDCVFHPKIDPHSAKMANRRDGSVFDHLYEHSKLLQAVRYQREQHHVVEQLNEELSKCTFTPIINNSS